MKKLFLTLFTACLLALSSSAVVNAQSMNASAGVQQSDRPLALTPAPLDEVWARSWWMPRHEEKLAAEERLTADLLFIGDSITQGWEGQGAEVWEEFYVDRNAFNLGYSGDRTENVLWRLENGEVDGMNPDFIVMMIGTNNTGHRQDPAGVTALGIETILNELEVRLPESEVLLLAIFPRGETPDDPLRLLNEEINDRIEDFADGERVHFLNINDVFLDEEGNLPEDIMPDMLHPNAYGYELWAEVMEPTLEEMLAQSAQPATVIPEPREFDWWTARHETKVSAENRSETELLFIGDSITHGWENENGGADVWEEYYGDRKAFNIGYGGDRTEHVLWRIQNGEVDEMNPELAVIMIGTNNTATQHEPEDIALGIEAIVEELDARLPDTKILLLGIFPRGETPDNPLRQNNNLVNEQIAELADGEKVFYLDIGDAFLDEEGNLPEDIMPDRLHPNDTGYQIWAETMEPTLEELLD